MRVPVALGFLALLATPARPSPSDVTVNVVAGRIDITAEEAPLSEVLDRLAAQTGTAVVYNGLLLRERVSVSLRGRTPAEAVTDLLKERKLNYAVAVDASGQVRTLIIVGVGATAAATPAAGPSPHPLLDLLERSQRLEQDAAAAALPVPSEALQGLLTLGARADAPSPPAIDPSTLPAGPLRSLWLPPAAAEAPPGAPAASPAMAKGRQGP